MAEISSWNLPIDFANCSECTEDIAYFDNLDFNIPRNFDCILDDFTVFVPPMSSSSKTVSQKPASTTSVFTTPTARWAAVSRRDGSASTAFVYAVMTTKIYCRPTCPARLARRANVTFFDDPPQAEAKGYRACKRCKPNQSREVAEEEGNVKQKVKEAMEIVVEAATKGEKVGLKELSNRVGVSRWHLQRVFKKLQGVSPSEMGKMYGAEGSTSRHTGSLAPSVSQNAVSEVTGSMESKWQSPTTWPVTTNAPTPLSMDLPISTETEMPELPWSLQSNPSESSEESFIDPGSWTTMINPGVEVAGAEATLRDLFPELYEDQTSG